MKKTVKVVVAGAGATGKTTLCKRLNGINELDEICMTPGVELHGFETEENEEVCIWDMGGQERFRFVQDAYLKGTKILILIYSVEWIHSVRDLNSWLSLLPKENRPNQIFLVANKIDSPNQVVLKEDVQDFIAEYNMEYYELSAKTGEGVGKFKKRLQETIKKLSINSNITHPAHLANCVEFS